jgi:hypothetical protein
MILELKASCSGYIWALTPLPHNHARLVIAKPGRVLGVFPLSLGIAILVRENLTLNDGLVADDHTHGFLAIHRGIYSDMRGMVYLFVHIQGGRDLQHLRRVKLCGHGRLLC